MADLHAIGERLASAALFLDFDGTLSEIVRHPEEARAVEGVSAALEALAARAALVAVITGRPARQVRERLAADDVEVHGLYGMEERADDAELRRMVDAATPLAEAAASVVPGAWVERKGLSVAVHFRETEDPERAGRALLGALEAVAEGLGLHLLEGKRVVELAAERPSKGTLVERLARDSGAGAVLFAGDDVADLDAFDALDRLEGSGVPVLRVAVRGPETPSRLVERADLMAEGPSGLLGLLLELIA